MRNKSDHYDRYRQILWEDQEDKSIQIEWEQEAAVAIIL